MHYNLYAAKVTIRGTVVPAGLRCHGDDAFGFHLRAIFFDQSISKHLKMFRIIQSTKNSAHESTFWRDYIYSKNFHNHVKLGHDLRFRPNFRGFMKTKNSSLSQFCGFCLREMKICGLLVFRRNIMQIAALAKRQKQCNDMIDPHRRFHRGWEVRTPRIWSGASYKFEVGEIIRNQPINSTIAY